jgi:hypothetical protein
LAGVGHREDRQQVAWWLVSDEQGSELDQRNPGVMETLVGGLCVVGKVQGDDLVTACRRR